MRRHPNRRFNLRQFADNSYYSKCMLPEIRHDTPYANPRLAMPLRLDGLLSLRVRRFPGSVRDCSASHVRLGLRLVWVLFVWVLYAVFSSVDDHPAEVAG
jgi:hypothetical protein